MTVAASRLRRLIATEPAPRAPVAERCGLCSEKLADEHRHMLDLPTGHLICVCTACSILFDRKAASTGHYRLVPRDVYAVAGFSLDDAQWDALRLPVEMAFFYRSTPAERVFAYYPSPAGATQSLLDLSAWEQLEADNPVLRTMEPDVLALLVNRARGERSYWIAPIDVCYELVAVIRTRWRGLGGGEEVWLGIDEYFAGLAKRASPIASDGRLPGSAHNDPA